MDFGDISTHIKPLIETHLDHWHLNETLETDSPTAECIRKPEIQNSKFEFEKRKFRIDDVRYCNVDLL